MAYTTIDDPSAYFQTALWTGNSTDNRSITNDGNSDLQPDFIWIKNRSSTQYHYAYDSSRGANVQLLPYDAAAESTVADRLQAFESDGFQVGASSEVNYNNYTYVAWQWKVNGGTRTTFSESGSNAGGGYQVNTTAGISIVDYTGTGSSGATITHGLGATPEFFVVKGRSIGDSWTAYHHKNTSAPETDMMKLDENGATQDNSVFWNDTAPTSTVFTVDGNNGEPKVNQDGQTYIAYCFRSIQGYSKFGGYTGNGNADGVFNYLGFLPKFLIVKRADSANHWLLMDAARADVADANPVDQWLRADTNDAESSGLNFDFLSNGFKCRSNDPSLNADGGTYIYCAWAEHPFVSSEGVPCPAR